MLHPAGYIFCAILTVLSATDTPQNATGTVPASLYPEVETSVDKNEIKIGDLFHLTISFTHRPEVEILEKGHEFELGKFVIRDINPKPEKKLEDGRIRAETVYTLSTYFTGEYEIPALDVRFKTRDGRLGSFKTNPITINVRSLTPAESEELDIRDIKSPILLAGQSRWWIVFTALAAIILLAGFIYWYFFLRKKDQAEPAIPPLPPHELALQRLEELRQRTDLVEEKKYKEFSTRLSEILRVYITQRWFIHAMDLTSHEILAELRPLRLGEDIEAKFQQFFEECDLIKFARHEPQIDELSESIDIAVEIVHATQDRSEDIKKLETTKSTGNQPLAVGE